MEIKPSVKRRLPSASSAAEPFSCHSLEFGGAIEAAVAVAPTEKVASPFEGAAELVELLAVFAAWASLLVDDVPSVEGAAFVEVDVAAVDEVRWVEAPCATTTRTLAENVAITTIDVRNIHDLSAVS